MKKQKKNKGVTLITVVFTVVIMSILLATLMYNANNRNKMSKLDYLYTDLSILEEKYKLYYQQYDYIPVEEIYTGETSQFEDTKNPNDSNNYYVVNVEKLNNVSLKTSGTFIINEKTLTVYFVQGITVDGITYYTLPNNSNSQEVLLQTKPTQIRGVSDGSWSEEKQVNTPQLLEGMIPVYWTSEGDEIEITGNVQKQWENWYDYGQQKWANAVTKDEAGNITGYWVWIPRYEYAISNPGTGAEQEISIKFIKTSQTTPDEGYTYIHPAFTDGTKNRFSNGEWDEEISGFWVSKYMAGFQASTINQDGTLANSSDTIIYSNSPYTSYNSSYTTNAINQNLSQSGYSTMNMSYPVFKPLTYTYNVISIGDCYTISKQVANATNFYGLNKEKTDSHLVKNSEFGAVTYLAHSTYGTNRQPVASNSKNVNNASKNIYGVTGFSGTTAMGTSASSTQNMSGIFDLVGCNYEYTSAYLTNESQSLSLYGSSIALNNIGEHNTSSTKYATTYQIGNTDTTIDNYNIYKNFQTLNKHGDAIFETSASSAVTSSTSWLSGLSQYPNDVTPFFIRTIPHSGVASMFGFNRSRGAPNPAISFRVVLTRKKLSKTLEILIKT